MTGLGDTPVTKTILFTDLVASTVGRHRVGERDADALWVAHLDDLRAATEGHGGHVVKSTGDGIMAVFDSAAGALEAGALMQRSAERLAAHYRVEWAVRVGISAGDVVELQGDWSGLPAVIASRLTDAAKPGQTLCTGVVRALAGARTNLQSVELGRWILPGVHDPVEVCEVQSPDRPVTELAFPARLDPVPLMPLVGRHDSLTRLQELWATARAGHAAACVLDGEPGAGKTRLATELARQAAAEGAFVLHGRCLPEMAIPYQPFAEAIRSVAEAAPDTLLAALPRRSAGSPLVRLVPELGEPPMWFAPPPDLDPDDDRARLYKAVVEVLSGLARLRPVVFLIDDIQWANAATCHLLAYTLDSLGEAPVFMMVTRRTTEPAEAPEADRVLRRSRASVLPVGGLAVDDIAEGLARAVPHLSDRASELALSLHDLTAGNAFFVTEYVRRLAAGQPVDGDRPEAVTTRLAERIDRLDPNTVEVLRAGAVAGPDFPVRIVGHVTGFRPAELAMALESARSAGLITELPGAPAAYRFAHTLTRDAVYDSISVTQRRELHRRTVVALMELDPAGCAARPAEPAAHAVLAAESGDPHDVAVALGMARMAGETARQQLAHTDAAGWFERALDLTALVPGADAATRLNLLVDKSEAASRAGQPGAAAALRAAARAARDSNDETLMARALLAGSRGFFSRVGTADRESIELLDDAIARCADDPGTTAELRATLAAELTWEPEGERRFALSDQALADARRAGDDRVLARVLALRHLTISAADTLDERTANGDELIAVAERLDDDAIRFDAVFHRTGSALEVGQLDLVERLLDEAAAIARELREPRRGWLAGFSQAALLIARGRLEEAEPVSEAAMRLGQRTDERVDALIIHGEQLFEIRRLQGRLEEVRPLIEQAAASPPIDGHAVTRWLIEGGLIEMAEERLRLTLPGESFMPRRDLLELTALGNLTHIAARLARRDLLPALARALEAHAAKFGRTSVLCHAGAHYLGMAWSVLDDNPRAEAAFETAARVEAQAGAPLLRAETLIEWAAWRRSQGDRARAAELAGAGSALAEEHRAPGLVARAMALR